MSDQEIIHRSLGRIEGKIDGIAKTIDGHDKRIGSVEQKVWWFSGVFAFLAFLATKLTGNH